MATQDLSSCDRILLGLEVCGLGLEVCGRALDRASDPPMALT